MFLNNFSLFNEEVGEMSYSCLARMTMHDTKKGEIGHVSMLYCLIQDYAAVDDAIWGDHSRASMRHGNVVWKRDSPAAVATRLFMARLVRSIEHRQYYVYPTRTQKKGEAYHEQYKSRLQAQQYLVNADTVYMSAFWKPNIGPEIDFHMRTVRNTMFGSFGHSVRHIWPSMILAPDEKDFDSPIRRLPNDAQQYPLVTLDNECPDEDLIVHHISDQDELSHDNVPDDESDDAQENRVRQLREIIGIHRTKPRTIQLNTRVWTIDFTGAGNEVGLWEGIIQARALAGGRRGQARGIPTPAGHHRVLITDTEVCEDIDGTNIDVNHNKALIRLAKVLGTYREIAQDGDHEMADYELHRRRTIEDNNRVMAVLFK